ncbi:hypothetical protein PRIPAC_80875 [Pristionchus pacificus]|nr:hypothetical protein PRIPAC_80875 [Pristionchus pacificus]
MASEGSRMKPDESPELGADAPADYSERPKPTIGSCIATLAVTIGCVAVCNVFSILLIVLGALNVDNCPEQPMIPVYLIVCGAVSIVASIFRLICDLFMTNLGREKAKDEPIVIRIINGVYTLFGFSWLICGMVWTFGASPTYEPGLANYCDYLTYIVAYVSFVIMIVLLVASCCCCAFALAMAFCTKYTPVSQRDIATRTA